jgi:hypothetical protein
VSIVTGQKIALGHIHTRKVVMVRVAAETITIDLGGEDTCTVRRTRQMDWLAPSFAEPRAGSRVVSYVGSVLSNVTRSDSERSLRIAGTAA